MKTETLLQIGITLILFFITCGGSLLAVDKYFAKQSEVKTEMKKLETNDKMIGTMLDVTISSHEIYEQEQHIQNMKNYHIFEQQKDVPEYTDMEKDALEQAEDRLEELKIEKDLKIQQYEEIKKTN